MGNKPPKSASATTGTLKAVNKFKKGVTKDDSPVSVELETAVEKDAVLPTMEEKKSEVVNIQKNEEGGELKKLESDCNSSIVENDGGGEEEDAKGGNLTEKKEGDDGRVSPTHTFDDDDEDDEDDDGDEEEESDESNEDESSVTPEEEEDEEGDTKSPLPPSPPPTPSSPLSLSAPSPLPSPTPTPTAPPTTPTSPPPPPPSPTPTMIISAINKIFTSAQLNYSSGSYLSALSNFQAAKSSFSTLKDFNGVRKASECIAECYVKLNRFTDAISTYRELLVQLENEGSGSIGCLFELSKLLIANKDYEEGLDFLNLCLEKQESWSPEKKKNGDR